MNQSNQELLGLAAETAARAFAANHCLLRLHLGQRRPPTSNAFDECNEVWLAARYKDTRVATFTYQYWLRDNTHQLDLDTFDYRDDAELRRLVRRIYGLDAERSPVPPQQISPHELCYTNSRTEVPLTRPDVMALLAMAAGAAGEWRTPSGHRPDPTPSCGNSLWPYYGVKSRPGRAISAASTCYCSEHHRSIGFLARDPLFLSYVAKNYLKSISIIGTMPDVFPSATSDK